MMAYVFEIVLVINVGCSLAREVFFKVRFEGLAGELKLWEKLLGWLLAIVVVSEGLL